MCTVLTFIGEFVALVAILGFTFNTHEVYMTTPDTQHIERATPAEVAKAYAAQHGFTIRANGRRYDIDFGTAHVANVGGYPAALNAMKSYEPPEMRDAREDIASALAADSIVPESAHNKRYKFTFDSTPRHVSLVDKSINPDMRVDSTSAWQTKTPEQILADMVDGAKAMGCTEVQAHGLVDRLVPQDAPIRKMPAWFDRGTYGKLSQPFDEFDTASQERIRKAANRISKQRRRAAGKPPGGPWHVTYNGQSVMHHGYPTRADALKVVRQGFNYPNTLFRNNWRTAAVTVEYRPS